MDELRIIDASTVQDETGYIEVYACLSFLKDLRKAIDRGDLERARALINEKMPDPHFIELLEQSPAALSEGIKDTIRDIKEQLAKEPVRAPRRCWRLFDTRG